MYEEAGLPVYVGKAPAGVYIDEKMAPAIIEVLRVLPGNTQPAIDSLKRFRGNPTPARALDVWRHLARLDEETRLSLELAFKQWRERNGSV